MKLKRRNFKGDKKWAVPKKPKLVTYKIVIGKGGGTVAPKGWEITGYGGGGSGA